MPTHRNTEISKILREFVRPEKDIERLEITVFIVIRAVSFFCMYVAQTQYFSFMIYYFIPEVHRGIEIASPL